MMRSQLALDAVDLFKTKIGEIPRFGPFDQGEQQSLVENQLSAAVETIQSRIPFTFRHAGQVEEESIPLMPIFNQILALMYITFVENRKLVFRVFRSEMTQIVGSEKKQRFTDIFAGAYLVLFEPDHTTGLFRAVEPTEKDLDSSFIIIDCFSKYVTGTNGKGLDSPSLEEHRAAFTAAYLPWLLLQYATCHPAYTANAEDKRTDFSDAYKAVCTPQQEDVLASFNPTRDQFDQFNLTTHLPGQIRPNLHDLWVLSRQQGEKRLLHDNCQNITGPYRFDLYERINRAVDWQPDHIYPSTLRKAQTDLNNVIAKHAASPNAVFGPWIVRAGSVALSFCTEEQADEALKENRTNKRKAFYKKVQPENRSFV